MLFSYSTRPLNKVVGMAAECRLNRGGFNTLKNWSNFTLQVLYQLMAEYPK